MYLRFHNQSEQMVSQAGLDYNTRFMLLVMDMTMPCSAFMLKMSFNHIAEKGSVLILM